MVKINKMENIASKTPINKTAALVTNKGVHFRPKINKNGSRLIWEIQPPIKPVPDNANNLVGLRKGRLTVIGILDKKLLSINRKCSHSWWVVRCDCGNYSIRRSKSLLKKHNESIPYGPHLMCHVCDKKEELKERGSFQKQYKPFFE